MKFEDHCDSCEEKMGKRWEIVHVWLDEYAGKWFPWMGHRSVRHHKEGVAKIRSVLGDEAAKAAEIHIIDDVGEVMSRKGIRKRYQFDELNHIYDKYPNSGELNEEIDLATLAKKLAAKKRFKK